MDTTRRTAEKKRPTRTQPGEAFKRALGAISEGGAEILEWSITMTKRIDIEALAQATTDGLTSLALVVARQTNRDTTLALLGRYQCALESTGVNDAGAQLVGEMARVVGEIKE